MKRKSTTFFHLLNPYPMENSSIILQAVSPADLVELFRSMVRCEIESLLTQKNKEPQPAIDELLTVPQAAQFLSLSVPTIYGLINRKAIPNMKRSKRVYFSKDELVKYLQEGAQVVTDYQAQADTFLSKCKKKGGDHA